MQAKPQDAAVKRWESRLLAPSDPARRPGAPAVVPDREGRPPVKQDRAVVYTLTLLGLAITLAGIFCGVVAFLATLKAHDPDPLLRWWPRGVEYVRRVAVKISGWFGATTPTRYIYVTEGIQANDEFGVAAVLRSGLPVPPDLPLEEQIRLLVERIEDVEEAAKIDREHRAEELHALRVDLTGRADRLQ
jgi:hypothetical protein